MNKASDEVKLSSIVEEESSPYLLDTSALLSFIEDEAGACLLYTSDAADE